MFLAAVDRLLIITRQIAIHILVDTYCIRICNAEAPSKPFFDSIGHSELFAQSVVSYFVKQIELFYGGHKMRKK